MLSRCFLDFSLGVGAFVAVEERHMFYVRLIDKRTYPRLIPTVSALCFRCIPSQILNFGCQIPTIYNQPRLITDATIPSWKLK